MTEAGEPRRSWLLWSVAALLVAVTLAAAIVFRSVGVWLAAAAFAGVTATIAGMVQATADRGLRAARRLVNGSGSPVKVSAEFWQQPLLFVRGDNDPGHRVRCGFVLLLVEATSDQAVILRRLRVVVESRGPATSTQPDSSHEPVPMRTFLVDLDDPEPRPAPAGVPDFPYLVSPSQPEAFKVMAYTERGDIRWRLALDWTYRGVGGSVTIDSDGLPFRVAQPPPDVAG
jgi:hypothetical protein